jgi:hypothetical protein
MNKPSFEFIKEELCPYCEKKTIAIYTDEKGKKDKRCVSCRKKICDINDTFKSH